MAILVEAEDLLMAVKIGLAKVKDAQASLGVTSRQLNLLFAGASVRYERTMDCQGKNMDRVAFDATLFYRLVSHMKGQLSLTMDGSELKITAGNRAAIKIPTTASGYDYGDGEDAVSTEEIDVTDTGFKGWLKNHPLNSAVELKRTLSSIKDNITKTELVVDIEWGGKSDVLKIKMVDQFHGILAYVKLPDPIKKRVNIRLPLTSFLLLLDITGKMFVDSGKVIVKNDNESLTCRFLAGSSFGTIDDMVKLISSAKKSNLQFKAKDLHDVVKRVTVISESDDFVTLTAKDGSLLIDSSTNKASIQESLEVTGKLDGAITLSPKNLQDITSCLTGEVGLSDLGHSVIFMSTKGNIVVNAALVKMEV